MKSKNEPKWSVELNRTENRHSSSLDESWRAWWQSWSRQQESRWGAEDGGGVHVVRLVCRQRNREISNNTVRYRTETRTRPEKELLQHQVDSQSIMCKILTYDNQISQTGPCSLVTGHWALVCLSLKPTHLSVNLYWRDQVWATNTNTVTAVTPSTLAHCLVGDVFASSFPLLSLQWTPRYHHRGKCKRVYNNREGLIKERIKKKESEIWAG